MATRLDISLPTTINVDSPVSSPSITNGSSARKFVAADLVQNFSSDQSFDPDLLDAIDVAQSLESLSKIAASAAQSAQTSLASTRDQLAALASGKITRSGPNLRPSAGDVARAQQTLAQQFAVSSSLQGVAVDVVGSSAQVSFLKSVGSTHTKNISVPTIGIPIVDLLTRKGVVDNFYVRLPISIPASRVSSIRAIRIFRTEVFDPNVTQAIPKLSLRGIDALTAHPLRSRIKNEDVLSTNEIRLLESGVDNSC